MSPIKFFKSLVALWIVLQSLITALLMRPMQDDYFNLQSVQQSGVIAHLENVWESHGGNMVQFLIHCFIILPTTQSFVYWNLAVFFILTQVTVFFLVRAIVAWLFVSPSRTWMFWVPLLSTAGFEGLFVPGFLGAFGFSLASLAHLWPVLAFLFALISLRNFRGSWLLALALGMVAGNSNLAESAFACAVWLLIFIAQRLIQGFESKSGFSTGLNFSFLGVGVFLGTAVIAISPGLWNRAGNQVGLPGSIVEFLKRFVKSFASFTADALTHPMVWVFFFLGLFITSAKILPEPRVSLFRVKLLGAGTLLIWGSLVFGSTFAYPAWHQSMGIYVLLLPFSFAVGAALRTRFSRKHVVSLLIISSMIMSFTFLRIGILSTERSLRWDRNLVENSCRLHQNPNAKLLGAEIHYPPFGLGVDDVNSWDWMRDKYASWVQAIPDDRCIK